MEDELAGAAIIKVSRVHEQFVFSRRKALCKLLHIKIRNGSGKVKNVGCHSSHVFSLAGAFI